MTQVMIIVPYEAAQEAIDERLRTIDDRDIVVHTTHVYGTETAERFRDMDIIVARGMTCAALRRQYPGKHIIEISITSFDILDAVDQCMQGRRPGHIALCVHSSSGVDMGALERLASLRIHVYDTPDETALEQALEEGRRAMADVFIGGLTMTTRCAELGLRSVHIKASRLALELAVNEAIAAARTINTERAKANTVRMVLGSTPDPILAVDTAGRVTVMNNQAHTLLRVPITDDVAGKTIDGYCKGLDWEKTIRSGEQSERTQDLFGALHYVRCRPVFVDSQCVGALIIMQAAAQIQAAETKIRKELSAKGLTARYGFADIIGVSDAMKAAISTAKKFSQADANVLLIGETGTGKELFAHSIHRASRRQGQPFVAVNCAALPEALLESELFGYVEGAFSGAVRGGKLGLFEMAHKGTIFLDEIGELPAALQAKLLRVLQEKEIRRLGDDRVHHVDVRVISATNVDIKAQIAARNFRADLYYRLNLLSIQLPPLRKRKEDVLAMADFFLKQAAIRYERPAPTLTGAAVERLRGYAWPGNSRELRNFCEKLIVLSESDTVDAAELVALGLEEELAAVPGGLSDVPAPEDGPVDKEALLRLLARPTLKKEELAAALGVSRSTLWRWTKGKK